jgi:UDP-glucose 4-epimerase
MTNVDGIHDEIDLVEADTRDAETVADHVADAEIVYHCAAQLSRLVANEDPQTDIDINCKGIANVLSGAAACDDPPHVVFASSLAVYGQADTVPVDESTAVRPIDMYGANKAAGEHYCRVYRLTEDVPTTVFRPANVYGPRSPLLTESYGVQYQFLKAAMADETLTVFEPGTTVRDLLHVRDLVDALDRIGRDEAAIGETYVVGSGEPTTLEEMARTAVTAAGSGSVELVPWPDEWDSVRRGDVYTDPSKLRSDLGWSPSVDLETGFEETVAFYRDHWDDYS